MLMSPLRRPIGCRDSRAREIPRLQCWCPRLRQYQEETSSELTGTLLACHAPRGPALPKPCSRDSLIPERFFPTTAPRVEQRDVLFSRIKPRVRRRYRPRAEPVARRRRPSIPAATGTRAVDQHLDAKIHPSWNVRQFTTSAGDLIQGQN